MLSGLIECQVCHLNNNNNNNNNNNILVVTDFSALQSIIVSANLTWFNRNCNTIMLFMIKHGL